MSWRGGEKVLETLADLYPQADIFTLIADPKILPSKIRGRIKRTSWLQRLPFRRHFRYALPLFPWTIERFSFDGYDVVISISHTVAKGVRTGKALHICYCLTPMRVAWVFPGIYFGSAALRRGSPQALLMRQLRRWDKATAPRVHAFYAISKAIQIRIEKYYERPSRLIYPPVDCDAFESVSRKPADHYLLVAALVPYKKTELAIEAFNRLGKPLVIVGVGPEERRLRKISSRHIRWAGPQSTEALRAWYACSRALICPQEEDFGIAAVEAQATGCPVIAYAAGGAGETIIDGQTGVLFTAQTAESLMDAVGRCETIVWDTALLRRNARRFDRRHFSGQFHQAVLQEMEKFS
ncbi:MAG: glycosyltransferase [Candidatus Omnitrophica bacterium]|nr:glycosyltransferase [Candidatus Omnitrophota bacterium]